MGYTVISINRKLKEELEDRIQDLFPDRFTNWNQFIEWVTQTLPKFKEAEERKYIKLNDHE